MSTHDREQSTLARESEPEGRWTRRARKVLSPANVMSATALFVALGGTAYATGIVVPRDSVGDAQIRYHAVRGKHIASDAITTSKVRNGSLRAEDFGKGELPSGAQGPAGPAGPTGLMGPAGAAGAQGPVGPMGLTGLQGPIGPIGPQGLMGLPGAAGETGPQGPAGPTGAAGAKGDTGDAGPAGPAGPAGAKGDTGDAGPAGPAGPKGDTGDTGPAGTGVTGASASASNSGGTVAVVLGGTSIPLPNSQNIGTGISVNGISTVFTVANAGRYRISYAFRFTASMLVSSRILINGTPESALIDAPSLSTPRLSGDAIVSLAAGATVEPQLYGLIGAVVLQNGAGAGLVIERVS